MTTDELNRVLNDEFERCTPELSIVPSAIIAKGRRRARARLAGLAGGGVAAIAAVAVLLPTVFAGGTAQDAAVPPLRQDPSEYPIAFDPNVEYIWSADESRFDEENEADAYTTTPATEELTTAWLAGLEALGFQGQGSWNEGAVTRHNEVLTPDQDQSGAYGGWAGDESKVLAERLAYSAQVDTADGIISLYVRPAGLFLRGAGTQAKNPSSLLPDPRYLVPGCDSYTYMLEFPRPAEVETTFECVESEGSEGERILSVRPSQTTGGRTSRTIAYLVVYRADGSAVLITERSWNETSEPSLSDEQMTALALALPAVPVE
ncbi:hypothetical protein AB0I28_01845 [Phytomonospora sp. NPDC050363]|uniref:hypothetical protein n=1 Tax=Phytomonospora sp. NPDC050363 TaxID=3155642 RepID=UPI0033CC7871